MDNRKSATWVLKPHRPLGSKTINRTLLSKIMNGPLVSKNTSRPLGSGIQIGHQCPKSQIGHQGEKSKIIQLGSKSQIRHQGPESHVGRECPKSPPVDVILNSFLTFLFSTSNSFCDIKQCVTQLLADVAPVNCSALTPHRNNHTN